MIHKLPSPASVWQRLRLGRDVLHEQGGARAPERDDRPPRATSAMAAGEPAGAATRPLASPARPPKISRTILTATLIVVGVVVALYLLYRLRQPIAWLVIAAFVAVVLAGPANLLSRWLPRGLAIALTYLGVLLVPIALALIVLPPFVREATRLIGQLPGYAAEVAAWVQSNQDLRELDDQYHLTQRLQEQAAGLPARIGDAARWLGDLGLDVVNSAFAAVTILILSVFLTANGHRWAMLLVALRPPDRAARLASTLERMSAAVGAYVGGALVQAAVAGLTTFLVLLLLGVPFAAPLAVVVALFDLIPMIGATIAAVLVGIVTLFADFPTDTLVWAAWALVYQQLENNLIQPRIQNRAVGLHPFAVIVAVLCGGTLFGVPGALLAVPVAAALQILARDWWAWRQLDPERATADGGPGPR